MKKEENNPCVQQKTKFSKKSTLSSIFFYEHIVKHFTIMY